MQHAILPLIKSRSKFSSLQVEVIQKNRFVGLQIYRGLRPHPAQPPQKNECSRYDTKLHLMVKALVLELWEMKSISSLPVFPGPQWPGVVAQSIQNHFNKVQTIIKSYRILIELLL